MVWLWLLVPLVISPLPTANAVPLDTNLKTRTGSTIVSWSSLTGWAAEGAGSSIAAESTILPPFGGQAIRVSNSNAGGTPQASNFSVGPFDLVNESTIIECPIYVPTDHIGGSFRVMLGSGGGFTNNYSKDVSSSKTLKGWNLYRFRLSELTKTGSPVVTAINAIRIRAVSPAGVVSYAIFGPITIRREYKPVIILSFDDGLKSVHDIAKPILDSYNIKATVFFGMGSAFGPTTFSQTMLTNMYNAGWDLSSHLYNQAPILTSGYTAAQQREQICRNILEITQLGFTRGSTFLSWPGGEVDDTVIGFAQECGVILARTTQNDNFPLSQDGVYTLQRVPGWSFDSGVRTINQVLTDMQMMIDRGQSVIWYGHGIVAAAPSATEITTADFTTLVKQVAKYRDSGQALVLTLTEFYNMIYQGRLLR